jgi:regulator of protease activity HflC (stomatin/prohibitin superfamily)
MKPNSLAGGIVGIIVGIIGLSSIFGSFYSIDQGQRGVLLRNREIVRIVEPGLHWKIPFIDSVGEFSVQTHVVRFDNMQTQSRDQQPTELTVSVNYQLVASEVDAVYAEYGSEDGLVSRLLSPRVQAQTKNVFGRFNAVTAVQERERLNTEIQEAIQAAVGGPVLIESVQLENIGFSEAYKNSIEQRMLAEVEVEKVRQNLEREQVEADIVRTRAQATADATVAQATAEAEAIRIRGLAEAEAINARGTALRDNPDLVELVQAEKWNGVLPTTMLPSQTLPIIRAQ